MSKGALRAPLRVGPLRGSEAPEGGSHISRAAHWDRKNRTPAPGLQVPAPQHSTRRKNVLPLMQQPSAPRVNDRQARDARPWRRRAIQLPWLRSPQRVAGQSAAGQTLHSPARPMPGHDDRQPASASGRARSPHTTQYREERQWAEMNCSALNQPPATQSCRG